MRGRQSRSECRQRCEQVNATGEKNLVETITPAETAATAKGGDANVRVDLPLTGMTCAACARRIERRLSKTEGVESAAVNFATARATVEYDPERTGLRELKDAVRDIGYGVIDVTATDAREGVSREEEARREEARDLKRRLVVAVVFSLPVLVIAMSHGRVSFLNVSWINWVQLALTAPVVFYSGAPFYRGAWAALRHRAADMNTLIATGTAAAFLTRSSPRSRRGSSLRARRRPT